MVNPLDRKKSPAQRKEILPEKDTNLTAIISDRTASIYTVLSYLLVIRHHKRIKQGKMPKKRRIHQFLTVRVTVRVTGHMNLLSKVITN